MLLNVVLASFIIGSITLLIVKGDEKTGVYREALQVLYKYSALHNFDKKQTKRLKNQLKLDFENKEVADEQVLQFFPAGVRRKILRRLYMPSLLETRLMKGTRQQFVDTFLSLCSVETFSPGEELLVRGSISSDLYLLLEGNVEIPSTRDEDTLVKDQVDSEASHRGFGTSMVSPTPTSVASSSDFNIRKARKIETGEFLNELGKILSALRAAYAKAQANLTLQCRIFHGITAD